MRHNLTLIAFLATFFFTIGCSKSDEPKPEIPVEPEVPENPTQAPILAYVFDINEIPEITLEVTPAEWNKLLSNYDINPDNEEYIMANYRFVRNSKSEKIDSIGIRIRGNSSRRRPEGSTGEMHSSTAPNWHHAHFALNFKKYVKSKRFNTLQKINLKWFKDDPNYIREVYCYDLFERYGVWTAPQSSYCRLSIKVVGDSKAAYFGVYQMIESIDEDFLSNRYKFNSKNGFLWKASYGADLRYADGNKMGIEDIKLDASLSKTYPYDLKTNDKQLETAKSQLKDFINNFNGKTGTDFQTWLESVMDVDFFLRTYAVNVMVGMWDDYWGNSNNYYMYFDTDGKFYFIPYDYDNTLGTSLLISNAGTQDPTKWGKDSNPIVKKILAIPTYRAMYIAHLKALADPSNDLFYYAKSITRIMSWQTMVRPFISNDTGEDMVIEDKPASWGNCGFYRLLSGDDSGNGSSANFFKTKVKSIPEQ